MAPGSLCPSHYISWIHNEASEYFIFQEFPDCARLMASFMENRDSQSISDTELGSEEKRQSKTMRQIMFDAILDAYEANKQNAHAACRELKISKATFYRELKRNNYKLRKDLRKKETEEP